MSQHLLRSNFKFPTESWRAIRSFQAEWTVALQVLHEVLPDLLRQVAPDLVLYNAGVDVHKDDYLGKMSLTDDGVKARDQFVFSTCAHQGKPIACAIGGGYNLESHTEIVRRHMYLHLAAAEFLPQLLQARVDSRSTGYSST